ncbi:flavodoxin [Anaerofustis sp. NSJ-163]|uniref:flavodoxin n=1 Tax=Anaerofustis sp. NSJ-163 TaxID=2944391 RepID=UPI00209C156C|nr:flavodoxin [Anaerofustis sp. NSJ-163]MCO8193043.1 flavodoxin [Anaerofustis sp. NSJ-163]
MKKTSTKIIAAVVVVAVIAAALLLFVNNRNTNDNTASQPPSQTQDTLTSSENSLKDGETLVVYFSAQGHTKDVAEQIAEDLDADIFEIVPQDEYTESDLDWTDDNSRVTREHEDESLRDTPLVSTTVDNWDSYENVLIGYPIWWGIAAWPVDTFVEANDFADKNVIPFCTSASSDLGDSGNLLKEKANGGNWMEGYRFPSSPSSEEITQWTDSLK